MDNIIFDKWIDIKSGVKVRIKRKSNTDDNAILILEINESEKIRQKALLVKDRKVFGDSGKMIDFGDAYPLTTEYGKIMITKKFISVWI
jgi:hypothetical protein